MNQHPGNDQDNDQDNNQHKNKRKNNPLVWGQYMSSKREKLMKQLNENCDQNNDQLFSGICVHINGVTDPSELELKSLIVSSGGMCLNHFDPKRTTHTIAENLPLAKIKNLKDNQIVVKPKWITDSVEAKQLLPVEDYLIIKRNHPIKQYFNKKVEITGHLVQDINQIIDSNDDFVETIDDSNDGLPQQVNIGRNLTTICERIDCEDSERRVEFNRSHFIPDSLSQIDPQFLDSLPEELRNELMKDIETHSNRNNTVIKDKNLEKQKKTKTYDSRRILAKDSKNMTNDGITPEITYCPNGDQNKNFGGLLTSVMTANICGKTDVIEVMKLIEEWVTTEEDLIDEDIAYITKYFCDLIDERKYNNLFKTFTKLFECIESRGQLVWKQSFNDIRNTIISETMANDSKRSEEINNLPLFHID